MGERPNLLLFMPDQLRADAIGVFGNQVVQTPNIDALASRGTRFSNAFSQHSVCSQSRISIFTGWYPHVAGHRTLTNLLKPWEPNLLRILRDTGYHVAWAGHRGDTFSPGVLEDSVDRHGFAITPSAPAMQDFVGHALGVGSDAGSKHFDSFYVGLRAPDVSLDLDEATVQTAESWLAEGLPEPWVLFVALMFPHPPFTVEEPWFSLHDRADVPIPESHDLAGKPRFMRALRDAGRLERLDERDWAEIVATYYGMISRVDDQLGRLVRAVDRAGATDRTATAFFTDHGEYLGDFGLVEKWPSGLDDCLLRNPLVIGAPGGREGNVCDGLVELVDLLPTLLDLAEVEAPHAHFGRSLEPALRAQRGESGLRDAAFSEGGFVRGEEYAIEPLLAGTVYENKTRLQHDDITMAGRAAVIRTKDWTYVSRVYEGDELYERHADPRERTNLHGRPEHAAIADALRSRLLEWMLATSDVVPHERDPRMDPEIMKMLYSQA